MHKGLLLVAASALAACGTATAAGPVCSEAGTALPAEWAGWDAPRAIPAGASPSKLDAARFAVGEAIDLRLRPDPEVAYISLPQGAGEAESFGGLAALHIDRAGTYAVGLGDFAWIDLVRDGRRAPPVSFGHGPDCTPVRKVVTFDLAPGDYVLEVSGNGTADLRIMVADAS